MGKEKVPEGSQGMCPLVAELVGEGRSELWAWDQGLEDLSPLLPEHEVMARKPEHKEEERSESDQGGQSSRLVGPSRNSGAFGLLTHASLSQGPPQRVFTVSVENTAVHN